MASTVGQTTTTTRSFEQETERKTNRAIYWALGFAVLVVLAIVIARNYSTRPAAVTTPANSSSTVPPVNNGMNTNGVSTGADSPTTPSNVLDTYGTTPVSPDASSTTAPAAPMPESSAQ